MRYRLQTKLSITYGLVALFTVGLIAILSRYFIDKQFISYVNSINEERVDNIVHNLEHQYHVSEGWDPGKIDTISIDALKMGVVLTVNDQNGSLIWSMTEQMHKTDEELLSKIRENMKSRYALWNGKIIGMQFPIHHGMSVVGTALVKYYTPFYFTDKDLVFINMLSKILGAVMAISIIFALLFGFWISRQISIPLSSTVRLTKEISRGNVSNRIEEKTNTIEIHELAEATNLLAEKLEEQVMIRKRIVSDVSHELRTPLAAIQNYIEALIDGVWVPSKDRLLKIHSEILRINRMVGELSKLYRYENNTIKLDKKKFSLGEMISRVAEDFGSQAQNKNISIRIMNTVNDIYADEDKLSQVIVNILSNSIKYSEDNSNIYISTYENGSSIFINIKDEGIGISEQELPYIFERFYRVDSSRNRGTGGSGIGLTISKAIIEAHEGTIEVKSRLGEWTEFMIKLPKKTVVR